MPKIAVVIGSNKSIDFKTVRDLIKQTDGIVYLTSLDKKQGDAAVAALNQEGLHPHYHQLDITDEESIKTFRNYLKQKYGFIDILYNDVAINNALEPVAVETLFVNYSSVLSTYEILLPIIRDGGRVVCISSSFSNLSHIGPSETLRKRFADPNLSIPELTKLMNQYIEAAKGGTHAAEWANSLCAVTKVGLTALTNILQRKFNERDNKRKRKMLAENAQTLAVPIIPTITTNPKPGTSAGQTPSVKTFKSTNEGNVETESRAQTTNQDEVTMPSGANKKARAGATLKTYAVAPKSDLIVAVTATNAGPLQEEQAEEVRETLNRKLWDLVEAKASNPPTFQGKPIYVNGSLQLWCMNVEVMEWVKSNIDGHTLSSGVNVEVWRQSNLPKKHMCGILIPGKTETSQIGKALRYFNPWAGVDRWLLHTTQKQTTDTFVVVSIPEDLIPSILEHGQQLCYMLGSVKVMFEEHKGRFSEVPPQIKTVGISQAKQQKNTPMTVEETTPQPSTSGGKNNTLQRTLLGSTFEAKGIGEWTQGMEILDIGIGYDINDGVPFTR